MAENVLRFDFLARDKATPTFEKMERNSDSLSRKLTTFGGVAATAFKTATVGAIGLGIAGVTLGVKTAAGLEQAQIGFQTLLGSGQKAKKFLGELKTFAAATPFELPGLIESSRTLLGVGASTKQTMGILKDFGDASSAVGVGQENFQRIIVATSQAMGAGRFMTADLNQITNNGIPIWTELAKATGKPIPELRKMASQGELLSTTVLPTLHKQMQKDYGGAMEKQSKTLNGLWSTFTDTLSIGLANAVQPMIPMLKIGLAGATKIAGDALKNIPGYVSSAREAFKRWHLDDFGTRLKKAAKDWGSKLTSGMKDGFGDTDMMKVAKDWGSLLFLGIQTGLRTGDWSELGRITSEGLTKAISEGADVTKVIVTALGKIDWFSIGRETAKATLPFAVAFVSNFGSNIFTVMREHPMDFALAVTSFLGIGKLGGVIARVLDHLPILRYFAPLFRKLESVTKPINDIIGKVTRFFGSAFGEGFRKVFPEIGTGLWRHLRNLADGIALRAFYAKDAALKFVRGLISGIGEGAGNLVKSIGTLIRKMLNPFGTIGRWLVDKGHDFVTGLRSGISDKLGPLSNTIGNIISRVTRPFSRAGQWLYQSGRETLAGLRNGMYNGVRAAGEWARGVGGRIVSAVKHFFGIHSPSRVFSGIGRNLIHSLLNSMSSANPVQFINNIFGGMPQALGAIVSKGLVHIENLPGKALSALSGLGGKFSGLVSGLFGGGGGGHLGGGLSAAERWIIMHESGGRTNAQNPTSTAFGLGQLLIANRRHYAAILGVSPSTTDYSAQLSMFRMYVRERYGNAENAMAFWQAHHWYGSGGLVSSPRLVGAGERGPERVLSATQTASFEKLVRVLDRGTSVIQTAGQGSTEIDYDRLGDSLAKAIGRSGLSVMMDGRAVGTVQGRQANILSRTA